MKRRTKWQVRVGALVSASAVAAALLMAPASSAVEAAVDEPATAKSTFKLDESKGYVIVNRANGIAKGDRTFYPTGPISADTMVVIAEPDGSLPGGLTIAKLDAMAAERAAGKLAPSAAFGAEVVTGPESAAAPQAGTADVGTFATFAYNGNSWSWTVNTGGSVIGWNDSAKVGYRWDVNGEGQQNAGSGLGYYRGYNGSVFGTWSAWYGLGYATDPQDGAGTVPWGNVTATTKFRAMCGTTTLCGGMWTAP